MEKKLFNKYFIGITLINFIVYLIYYLLMVIMAVIAQDTLHASLSQAGFASGIYIIGTLLVRTIWSEVYLKRRRDLLSPFNISISLYANYRGIVFSSILEWIRLRYSFYSYKCYRYCIYPCI